jgi:MFS family permease
LTKILTRTILLVSFVSLFTDIASEMLYPIMPVYLRSIGFSVLLIGILEGVAEATAGISKGYFGNLSDVLQKRVPFVRGGYTLSAISKPLLAFFTFPLWVFFARTIDRLGKGIRTSARDAMLSDETTPEHKGKVFGFHRSMDTVGAAIGPIFALIYLSFYPGEYKWMFIIAFFPGLIAILLTFFLKDKSYSPARQLASSPANDNSPARQLASSPTKAPGFFTYLTYWKTASPSFKKLTIGLLAFALFNSSDAFLLLALKNAGMPDTRMIMFYIFYNLVYAILSYPLGSLADRIGLKTVLILGLTVFSLVYFFFGFATSIIAFGILFLFYAFYAAATEGISKALITNLADKKDTATAIGFYTSFASILTLFSSSLSGLLWVLIGPKAMFMISGIGVFGVVVYLLATFTASTAVHGTRHTVHDKR